MRNQAVLLCLFLVFAPLFSGCMPGLRHIQKGQSTEPAWKERPSDAPKKGATAQPLRDPWNGPAKDAWSPPEKAPKKP